MYYDIHTHNITQQQSDTISVFNIYTDFEKIPADFFTAGLHPWYINAATVNNEMLQLEQLLANPQLLAVGECGLDKITATNWQLQTEVFTQQINLASAYKKTLIIHCVKAFTETLAMLKAVKTPVIFHGINNKLSIVQPVIKAGHYLSFGKTLLQPNPAIIEIFLATPLTQLFLETDDTAADIKDVYKYAAKIRNIDEKEIVLQLEENFNKVFHARY
mgnify:CR=1 FL=1